MSTVIVSSDESSDDFDVEAEARQALVGIIPEKSKERYMQVYNEFMAWMKKRKLTVIDENTMLAYFSKEMAKYKSSTRWCRYSMLKLTINTNNDIDITVFKKLTAYLKTTGSGYTAVKSKAFQEHELTRFVSEAEDSK